MTIQDYLSKMEEIQKAILKFIESDNDCDNNYNNITKLLNNLKLSQNPKYLHSVLHIIASISDNHNLKLNCLDKLFKILKYLNADGLISKIPNLTVFNIFKYNKKTLLFLINEHFIEVDNYITRTVNRTIFYAYGYSTFLYPEIKNFICDNDPYDYEKSIKEYYSKNMDKYKERLTFKNIDKINEIILNDSIKEFSKVYKNSKLGIENVFESNVFLLPHDHHFPTTHPSMIEYAAFCGSLNIFKFLMSKGEKLTPNLWLFAVHSNNLEIIKLLVKKHVEPEEKDYGEVLEESIKCHHNEIANYIIKNLYKCSGNKAFNIYLFAIKYHNYSFIPKGFITAKSFYSLCKYDYVYLLEQVLKMPQLDVNFVNNILESIFLY